jgi:hypothetical protein
LARLNCTPDGLTPSRTARPDPTTRNFFLKETTMNTKHIIAAAAIALTGAGAFAAEYTNFDIPSGSNLSRAEAASRVLGRAVHYAGDAAVFEIPTGSTLTRAEAASRVLGRTVIFNEATTFVDATPADERAMRVLARSFK